jgi:hypothetical protein
MHRCDVPALDDRGRVPDVARQSTAMLSSRLNGPLWAADLCMCETQVGCAGGVAEDPLDCLPMGMPGAGCDVAALSGGRPLRG